MAIDKNSRAYQSLLKSGYTDEQITQMHGAVAGGQSTQDVVENTQPTAPNTTSTTETTTPTQTTPITPEVKQETEIKQAETVGNTVPEIKQEGALKPLSQDYYNQTSDDAQSKIISNLNNYRQTNPEYFRDYESFKKNFSYDARNDEQKQTLDSWYGGYQKGMELAGIPVTDLYTQYKDGQVSMNELENLRIYDPTKYAELQAQINKGNIISAYDDDKGVDTTGMSLQDMAYDTAVQMFTKFMSGDSSSGASQYFRDYEEKMESPEMLALSDQCTEVQEQMENIQSDLDSIKKSVEAEYEGTGATRSKINAIIADRSYDLQLQLRTLNSEYTKYATQYNNRMNQYQNEFQMQLQEYQLNQDARNQQMKELGFAMDLMNFETNEQKAQREWDYWVKQQEYTNGNINSKDYDTRYKAALKSVQNLLSQYEGIPMQRSAEQMAQDVLKAIDNGSDLGTELTKINKQIQQKPEYKQLYNNTYGTGSSNTGFGKTIKIGDMELVEYNGQWLTADQVKEMFGKGGTGTGAAKPYDTVDPSKLNNDLRGGTGNNLGKFLLKKLDGMTGGQCGKYVNDYLEYIGMTGATNRYYDNELSTKLNSVNTYNPKEGTIAVFDYNHKSSDGINHGHVGIVTKVTADGIYVRDSNYSSNEKIKTRFIKKGSAEWENNLKGFFDPSQPPMGSSVTTEGTTTNTTEILKRDYNPTRVGLYDKYINEGTAPSDQKLKGLGDGDIDKGWQIFDAEVEDYMEKTGAGTLEKRATDEITKLRTQFNQEQTVKDYKDMLTNYSKIEIAANKGTPQGDMSLIFAYMKMLDPGSVVREGEYATAQNAGNVGDKIINLYNKAITGKKLTENQRKEFLDTAKSLMDGMTVNYNNLLDDYSSYISWGGDANKIGKKGTYITEEFINKYGGDATNSTTKSQSVNNGGQTIKSFKNNVTLTFPKMPAISNTVSTKDKLQSKYGLVK